MELAILGSGALLAAFALVAIGQHDWHRLARRSVRVKATVVGHQSRWDEGEKCYAARLAFEADGKAIEVVDGTLAPAPEPAVGTEVMLRYPAGRPDLARLPRPVTWIAVYAALVATLAMLGAELLKRLD